MSRRERVVYFLISLGWIGYGSFFLATGPVDTSELVVAIVSVVCGSIGVLMIVGAALAHLLRTTD
jgi:hypothetical protein